MGVICDRKRAAIVELIPALHAFSRRFHRNRSDADDLVQETLMKALANLEKFEEGTHMKSWLFTIMRNAFCTSMKIARRETPGMDECIALNVAIAPPQEWRVHMRDVQIAVSKLPPRYREAFDIIIVEGESYEVAARKLDCAIGTIKSRLNRARMQIAAELGMEEGHPMEAKKRSGGMIILESQVRTPVILIVEDEYLIGVDLADLLTQHGATPLGPAMTIKAALELVDLTETIDAAVLDINIHNEPVFEVADALGKKGVPFLFTSGYDRSIIPVRFREIHRHEKPINYNEFVRDLADLISHDATGVGGATRRAG